MARTALLALRMASASGFQVSINSPAARSTRNCNCDVSWRTGVGILALLRNRPGYTNRATKRAMLAAAASISFVLLPPAAGVKVSAVKMADCASALSALTGGGSIFGAEGSIFAAFSALTALSFLSFLSYLPGFSDLAC